MVNPEDVIKFWLEDVGPEGWYVGRDTLDEEIRTRFLAAWQDARDGKYGLWLTHARGALAYCILTDQFPRNMFRNNGDSFATDNNALAAAKMAIARKWDMRIEEPARQFFYMPLMHSENLCDQERCVRLMCERMPLGRDGQILHAKAHRQVIRDFGRFPYRNEALSRKFTANEQTYVANGGYGETMRLLQVG